MRDIIEYHKKYYEENRDTILERTKKFREENKEIIQKRRKEYYLKKERYVLNNCKYNKYLREYQKYNDELSQVNNQLIELQRKRNLITNKLLQLDERMRKINELKLEDLKEDNSKNEVVEIKHKIIDQIEEKPVKIKKDTSKSKVIKEVKKGDSKSKVNKEVKKVDLTGYRILNKDERDTLIRMNEVGTTIIELYKEWFNLVNGKEGNNRVICKEKMKSDIKELYQNVKKYGSNFGYRIKCNKIIIKTF